MKFSNYIKQAKFLKCTWASSYYNDKARIVKLVTLWSMSKIANLKVINEPMIRLHLKSFICFNYWFPDAQGSFLLVLWWKPQKSWVRVWGRNHRRCSMLTDDRSVWQALWDTWHYSGREGSQHSAANACSAGQATSPEPLCAQWIGWKVKCE